MTTRISKFLAVFITLASVGFMAVIVANVVAGGPNWKARAAELDEIAFEQANPQAPWTSKRRTNQEDMGGGPILPAAIVAVQRKLIQQESDIDKDLDQKIQALKSLIETNKVLNQTDLEAMKQRQGQLAALFAQREAEWKKITSDITAKTESLTKITGLTNVRNEESIRYKHQIEELIVEKQLIEEEVRRLKDLLFQAKANLERVQTRQAVLVEDGATIKAYDAGEAAAPANQPADDKAAKPDDAPESTPKSDDSKPDAPKSDEEAPESKSDEPKSDESTPDSEKAPADEN